MKNFTHETMWEILSYLEIIISKAKPHEIISFQVPNPDKRVDPDSSNRANTQQTLCLYHGWKAWFDLTELLQCRMMTPQNIDAESIVLRYQKLDPADSFHQAEVKNKKEKYGIDSLFSTIRKNEEPAFLSHYVRTLKQVKIEKRRTVLDLGINSGDEFDLIRTIVDKNTYRKMQLIGIDHSQTAIEQAKAEFPEENVTFHCHDINHLDTLPLPKADLLLSIGTLQSPGIDFKPLFMSLIQNHLTTDGAIILGFPNCRWIDGEMIYGARAPHYNFPEMSLVIKDIYFCKKYLQQHKFRVTVTGKDYLFLTATKIGITK